MRLLRYGVYDDVSDSLKSDAPLPHSHELEAEKLLEGDDEEIAEIAGETPAEAKTKVRRGDGSHFQANRKHFRYTLSSSGL